MEKKIICRKITEAEIPRSAAIVFEAFNRFAEEAGQPLTPDVSVVEDRMREYLNDTGIPGIFYGAFVEDEQLGVFMLHKLGIDEESWEISMMAVEPGHQRQGIGREMLKFGMREILENRGVLLVCAVIEGNEAALNFFADQGFECEASGVPVGDGMSIWMLRKDMENSRSAELAEKEAAQERELEEKAMEGMRLRPELMEIAKEEKGTIE